MTQKELMQATGYSQPAISRLLRQGLTEEMIIKRSAKRKPAKERVWREVRKLSALTGYSESTIEGYWHQGMSDDQIIERSKHRKASGREGDERILYIQQHTGYSANTIRKYLRAGMSVEEICDRGRAYRHDNRTAERAKRLERETGYTRNALYQKIREGKTDLEIIQESQRPYAHAPGLIRLAQKGKLGKHARKRKGDIDCINTLAPDKYQSVCKDDSFQQSGS